MKTQDEILEIMKYMEQTVQVREQAIRPITVAHAILSQIDLLNWVLDRPNNVDTLIQQCRAIDLRTQQ